MKSIFTVLILALALTGCATTQPETQECAAGSTETCKRTPSTQQERASRLDRHR